MSASQPAQAMHRVTSHPPARGRMPMCEGLGPGGGTTRRQDQRSYPPIARAKMFTIVSIALSFPSGDQLGYAICEFEA